jgi:hypothetical protein
MTGADRLDACRDAGALIRATADRDHEATGIILDNADLVQVAEILATIVVTACRGYGQGFITDLCDELRHLDQEDSAP